jgi:hypothetical protein
MVAMVAEEPVSSAATPVEVEKTTEETTPVEKTVPEVVVASAETPEVVPAAHIAPTLKAPAARPAAAPSAPAPAAVTTETPAAAPPAPKLTFGTFAAAAKSQSEQAASVEQPSEPVKTSFASFGQSNKLNPFAAAFQGMSYWCYC